WQKKKKEEEGEAEEEAAALLVLLVFILLLIKEKERSIDLLFFFNCLLKLRKYTKKTYDVITRCRHNGFMDSTVIKDKKGEDDLYRTRNVRS
ncbi:hypothetical protein ACJX0J_010494, partial [Zea mays]